MANIITAGNSTNGGTQIVTDTSGTLNIVTGSGSGSNAITIDASQNVSIPKGVGGTPAFSAYQSSAQSLTATTWTKGQFQTEEFDTTNAFDSTTNYRFQPTVAGYYSFTGGFAIASTNAVLLNAFYKNGSQVKLTSFVLANGVWGQGLIYLNGTTDYVELYFYSAVTQNTGIGAANTYFQGFLARAA